MSLSLLFQCGGFIKNALKAQTFSKGPEGPFEEPTAGTARLYMDPWRQCTQLIAYTNSYIMTHFEKGTLSYMRNSICPNSSHWGWRGVCDVTALASKHLTVK